MSKWQPLWKRAGDLGHEIALFVADVTALVAAIFYYMSIGLALLCAIYFRIPIAVVHSIELCIGTALVWGLAHMIGNAIDARQRSRSLGISSTKLQGW